MGDQEAVHSLGVTKSDDFANDHSRNNKKTWAKCGLGGCCKGQARVVAVGEGGGPRDGRPGEEGRWQSSV